MPEQTFEPPNCPECAAPLVTVYETVYEDHKFNPKTGTYSTDDWGSEMTIKCPKCGMKIRDLFEDGVCNFSVIDRADEEGKTATG